MLHIALQIIGWALVIPLVVGLGKAGFFKLTASIDVIAGAGLVWVKEIPAFLVRFIALLELAGVAGIILAPAASQFIPGFEWAAIWGVLAAAGLALTMVVAAIMHIVRGEFKYTWKANVSLFAYAALLTAVLAVLPLVLS